MTDIQPGDWVKCVRYLGVNTTTGKPSPWPVPPLVVGSLYRVLDVRPGQYNTGELTGRLVYIIEGRRFSTWDAAHEGGYSRDCFARLNRITDQFREKLLEKVDLDVTA